MDTLHCDICFGSVLQNQDLEFYCGQDSTCSAHIHCSSCVSDFCKVCKKRMKKILINNKMASNVFKKFIPLNDLCTSIRSSLKSQFENWITFEAYLVKTVFVKHHVTQFKSKMRREMIGKIQKAHHVERTRIEKVKKFISNLKDHYMNKKFQRMKRMTWNRPWNNGIMFCTLTFNYYASTFLYLNTIWK